LQEPLQQSDGTLHTAPPWRQHLLARHSLEAPHWFVVVQDCPSAFAMQMPASQFPLAHCDAPLHVAPPRLTHLLATHDEPAQQP
jgi:hypothetical protein